MQISKSEVEKVAKLARLEITEAEKEVFSKHLSSILTYIDKLKTLNTEGIEPTATVLEQTNVFREDNARPSLPGEKALANAPESEDGFFVVPKILEER
ncbi:MAG: Asp-tRNA(Asn)/Glu-tRNA(Gln) amidotransferase subunit GatC [Nitrospirae bacterium]|nr:MAG: Asp-tRNA(Asn)/Glu-tRNA(Gln) amidotransferase subunit GatC [Nitrospirota bacterium]